MNNHQGLLLYIKFDDPTEAVRINKDKANGGLLCEAQQMFQKVAADVPKRCSKKLLQLDGRLQ